MASIQLLGTTSSGEAPLTYLWTTSNGNIISGANSSTATVGTAGTYTLRVTNSLGVWDEDTHVVTENFITPEVTITPSPNTTELTLGTTQITLNGSATSGDGFVWTDGSNNVLATTQNLVVSSEGQYTLTVSDSTTGCAGSIAILITENNTPPTAIITGFDTLNCNINSRTLYGTSSLGNVLTYEWKNGGDVVIGTSSSITVTLPDTYKLTVTDGTNGLTGVTTRVVTQDITAPALVILSNDGNTITQTGQIITLTAKPLPVTSVLSYVWSTAETTQSIDVTSGDTYTVTGTSLSNGCTNTDSFIINEAIADLTVSYNSNDGLNLNCEFPELYITASVINDVGAITYEWWDMDTISIIGVGPSITIDQAGVYQVHALDAGNGNTSVDAFEILGTPTSSKPTAVATGPTVLSCTGTTTMDASSSSGIGTLRYEWWDMDTIELLGTGITQTITTTGTYQLYVYNGSLSCVDTDGFTMSSPSIPVGPINATSSIVYPGSPVTLSATITGGIPPYTYLWTESYGATITGGSPQTTTTVQAETGGLYYLKVTDSVGCYSSRSIGLSNGTTADTQAPTIPQNLVVNNYNTSTVTLDILWNASTDNVGVDHYELQRSVNGYPYGNYALNVLTNSFTDTYTSFGNTFCYKVRAVDAAGNASLYSNTDCETLPQVLSLVVIAVKAGDASIGNPFSYFGYSICDGQSGPFTHTFYKEASASVTSGMQLYTVEGDIAIPGNMGSSNYNSNYNTLGARWALIGTTVWQVTSSTGKLLSVYSNC
jgi:hypothetical protein